MDLYPILKAKLRNWISGCTANSIPITKAERDIIA